MRILVLTFYFEPDLCAGSFRASALVKALQEAAGCGATIDVLTTMPNRYRSFVRAAASEEKAGAVAVTRIPIPQHRSGSEDQSRAFAVYAYRVLRHTGGQNYDLIFATSSRLLTACLAALVAKRSAAPLYLDLRDIFVETVRDVFSGPMAWLTLPVFRRLERFAVHAAKRVNLVSEGFRSYFEDLYPGKSLSFYPNGIDDEFVEAGFASLPPLEKSKGVILYAGNIGEGQGLHRVVPALAKSLARGYELLIVGDGGARESLQNALQQAKVDNVRLIPPVDRSKLIDYYRASHCLFLHLNDHPAFERVLPSKIFEYAATGRPILAGVGGYAASFLRENVENCEVFPPCDSAAGTEAVGRLDFSFTSRSVFIDRFRRSRVMRRLAASVLEVGS